MHFLPLESPLKLYAVIPAAGWVERTIRAGADMVQLRCKTLHGNELRREIERRVAACYDSCSQLFINDYWHKAVTAGTYDVHLRQEDMGIIDLATITVADLRLGLSIHSLEEMDRVLALHPSYMTSGAVLPTVTKDIPTTPQGLEQLRGQIVRAGGTSVVAINGITLDNVADVLATGVASLAMVNAVTEAGNLGAVVKPLQVLWR